MNRKLPWILLGLSLVFNFAFTTGFLEARSQWRTAQQEEHNGEQLVADALKLTPQQRQRFARLRREAATENRRLEEQIVQARQELLAEALAPAADPQRLAGARRRLAGLHAELHERSAENLGRFMGMLTPEQRSSAAERIDRPGRFGQGRQRLRERFRNDEN